MTGSRRLGAGTRESVLRPGPRPVTELDERPVRSGLVDSEGVERGERMTFVRFLGVLALVLSLLIGVGSLALAPDGWGPAFHRLWGAIIVLLGIGFVAFGRTQERLVEQMEVRGQAEGPVSSEFECFGVAFAVSGTAYGLYPNSTSSNASAISYTRMSTRLTESLRSISARARSWVRSTASTCPSRHDVLTIRKPFSTVSPTSRRRVSFWSPESSGRRCLR